MIMFIIAVAVAVATAADWMLTVLRSLAVPEPLQTRFQIAFEFEIRRESAKYKWYLMEIRQMDFTRRLVDELNSLIYRFWILLAGKWDN